MECNTEARGLCRRLAQHNLPPHYVSFRVPSEPPAHAGQATTHAHPGVDFTSAYRNGALSDFFDVAPGDLEQALAAPRHCSRDRLADALLRYARSIGAPQAALDNIEKLRNPDSRAVVTGQQVGLMLGPTFTLSKAVTAIRLARSLDEPERPVVPVFWLATQDHDAAEVDHTYLLDADETLHRLHVDLPAGVAAGRVPVSSGMLESVRAGLAALTPRPRFMDEVLALVEEAAETGMYGSWFAALLSRVLGPQGLIIVDPLQPDFAALTAPIIRAEIADPERSSHAINDAGTRLKHLGFEPQLGRGAHATNLFIDLPQEGGLPHRTLLRHEGGSFYAEGRRFEADDLLAMLDDDPSVITPAAGLRPVTQDHAIPTAVLVLGPGELRYVAQLRGVYQEHSVKMPLAWPRASAILVEPAVRRLLGGLGVGASAFVRQQVNSLESLLLERSGHLQRFSQAADVVEQTFRTLLAEVGGIDPTLAGTVARGRRHLDMTLERLRSKSAAALLRKDADTARQFARLNAHLLPLGQPAERVLSPFSHALKFGVGPLVERFMTLETSGTQELDI